ncbi:MAG: hypothetical protein C0P66_008020 [Bacillaceae bacterium]|nr:hypothetical protein [Bacillaceae bacterium]
MENIDRENEGKHAADGFSQKPLMEKRSAPQPAGPSIPFCPKPRLMKMYVQNIPKKFLIAEIPEKSGLWRSDRTFRERRERLSKADDRCKLHVAVIILKKMEKEIERIRGMQKEGVLCRNFCEAPLF